MRRRTVLATAGATAVTLLTGVGAFGAATGLLADPPGPPHRATPAVASVSGPLVVPATLSRPGGLPTGAGAAASTPGSGTTVAPGGGASTTEARATTVAIAATPSTRPTQTDEAPPTSTAPPNAPTATTVPPPTTVTIPGCTASDDGLTPAQQQAREAACQGRDGG